MAFTSPNHVVAVRFALRVINQSNDDFLDENNFEETLTPLRILLSMSGSNDEEEFEVAQFTRHSHLDQWVVTLLDKLEE